MAIQNLCNIFRSHLPFDALTYLRQNYQEGIIKFFQAGAYTAAARNAALKDFRDACSLLACSDSAADHTVRDWAKKLVETRFQRFIEPPLLQMLETQAVQQYWDELELQESCNQRAKTEFIFYNGCAERFSRDLQRGAKRSLSITTEHVVSKRQNYEVMYHLQFQEVLNNMIKAENTDNVFLSGADRSVGQIIKQAALDKFHRFHEVSPEEQAMITLGLNSVLDISNTREKSQRGLFSNSEWEELVETFGKKQEDGLNDTLSKALRKPIDKIVKKAKKDGLLEARFHANKTEYLQSANNNKVADVMAIYAHCLQLMEFHKYLFNQNHSKLSEGDYVVKVWGPILETLFRSTDLRCKWNETIASCTAEAAVLQEGARKMGLKADLRIVADDCACAKEEMDVSGAEMARNGAALSKINSDRIKVILGGKCILDKLLETTGRPMEIAMLHFAGLCGEVVTINLRADGLYVAQTIGELEIPSSPVNLRYLEQTVLALDNYK
ncbi:hypothetical protein EC973_004814 [Apophysomyces ossiformis]|uniref:Uncharacterized protein n=1 Tax=Apophysomyces ossiformis TaxID=679940 RepID=A0A8H7BKW6_9FUNG|nr:hypothetical protein EC973_004814 [Apophysomyces ossiformis]